jgi:hypothetical protein
MSQRLDDFDFQSAVHGDAPLALAVEQIMAHLSGFVDVAGRQVFTSIVRHHDAPGEIGGDDLPQLRIAHNASRFDNPSTTFHPLQSDARLDLWLLYYTGDTIVHEQQRERLVRYLLRALSDPGNGYEPANLTSVYSQPDPSAAGWGFIPPLQYWQFATPQFIDVSHVVSPPLDAPLTTGMQATRITLAIDTMNNVEIV